MTGFALLITTILSSSIVSSLVGFYFGEAKERWLLRRTKIEEIYLNSSKWTTELSCAYVNYLPVCAGKISYNELLDMQIARSDQAAEAGEHHNKMVMNINMYEPSLIPHLTSLEAEVGRTNTLTSAIKSCYSETGQASEFLELIKTQLLRTSAATENLKVQIISRGRGIGAERPQIVNALFIGWNLAKASVTFFLRKVARLKQL